MSALPFAAPMLYAPRTLSAPRPEDSEPQPDPRCPGCGHSIRLGASVGGTPLRLLHLDCFLAEREQLSVVAALLVERPVCVPCVSDKTGLTAETIAQHVAEIARSLVVYVDTGTCSACHHETTVIAT